MKEMDPSDERLIARVAVGDESALAALAARHGARLLRLAERLLSERAMADDVVQEALVRLWKGAGRWRSDRSRLSTWLYTIVYRLCMDRLRARRSLPLEAALTEEDPSPGPLDALEHEVDLRQLAAALETLRPRHRAALTLYYEEGLKGEEAAAVLGVSLRAYWSLLHRARATVREMLDDD